ncbi:hypothetical protein BDQ12DRAFT_685081 [Crucibulum laeve]|uniref:Uncharacterized protein n=1 Tax=Crucibulum laeve TaxID=68775 RepID=A0A5C3LXL8_9AGAR|nr:hypothetical protein BDQ12DRAFT_685081 [Crucibulum laeve]
MFIPKCRLADFYVFLAVSSCYSPFYYLTTPYIHAARLHTSHYPIHHSIFCCITSGNERKRQFCFNRWFSLFLMV